MSAEHASVSALAAEHLRGSAFGLPTAVPSLGNFAAGGIAGILRTALSLTSAWTYLAAWTVLAPVGMVTARATD